MLKDICINEKEKKCNFVGVMFPEQLHVSFLKTIIINHFLQAYMYTELAHPNITNCASVSFNSVYIMNNNLHLRIIINLLLMVSLTFFKLQPILSFSPSMARR